MALLAVLGILGGGHKPLLHPVAPRIPQLLSRTSIANTRQDKTAKKADLRKSQQQKTKKMFSVLSIVLLLSISQTADSKPVFDLFPEGGQATALAGQREVQMQGDTCTCPEGREGEECKLDSQLVCRREVTGADNKERSRARRHKNRRRRLREQLRRILQGRE